jgi:ribonuclease VapC
MKAGPFPMVIDSSALLAVLLGESDAPFFIEALASPGRKYLSAMSKLETSIVIESRKGEIGNRSLFRLLAVTGIEIIAFDSGQAEISLDAWRRYGKGRHPASLNMGDCASYALAALMGDTLLYKGNNFALTDIAPADYLRT